VSLAEIKNAVDQLSPKEFAELVAFLRERDNAAWDKEFEEDVTAGRLDKLADEAIADLKQGRTTPL
jgi:hypothetical protein